MIVGATTAQQTATIFCNFLISGADYDCNVLTSFIPDDETVQIQILGQHQPNRDNSQVTRVLITNSFHPFIVRQFFSTFPNIHTYSYSQSTSPFRIQLAAFIDSPPSLRTISITGTPLAILNDHAFQGATNLETINLGFNQLTTIPQFALGGLSNLLNIELSGNQITSISDSALRQLPNLQSLTLNQNQLTRVSGNFLLTNPQLLVFQASNNNITEIGRRFLDPVANLNVLNLDGNECISQSWSGIGGIGGPTKDDIRGHLNVCFDNYGGATELKEFYLELRGNIRLYDEDFNFIGSI